VAAAQERQLVPLPVQDAIAARTFSTTPFSLSNDGYWIAYTLQDPKRSQIISDERQRWLTASGTPPQQIGCDVWITNVKTRETRNLTEGKGNSWSPVWSPDNNYLAFFSDRGGLATLWIWERRSETLRQVSDLPVVGYRGLSFPRWTADSKSIVFCVLPEGMTVEKAALRFTGREQPSGAQYQQAGPTDCHCLQIYSGYKWKFTTQNHELYLSLQRRICSRSRYCSTRRSKSQASG